MKSRLITKSIVKASKKLGRNLSQKFNSTAARAKAPYLPLYSQTSYLLLTEGGIRLGRDGTVRNGVHKMHVYLIAPVWFCLSIVTTSVAEVHFFKPKTFSFPQLRSKLWLSSKIVIINCTLVGS